MNLTETRKKQLIQKIIGPVMIEKGLSLRSNSDGIWVWEKDMHGIMEEVNLWDMDRSLSMHIGLGKLGGEPALGNKLWKTLENPRTDWTEWAYCIHTQKEKLYENILLDMRDILIMHCDAELERNAEEIRKAIPNRKHFEKLRDHYEQLALEYRGKLGTRGMDILEICEAIAEQVKMRWNKPLEEVEDDLVGYAALLESEILRQYGGIREVNEEMDAIVISKVGFGRFTDSFNVLTEIFWIWEGKDKLEIWWNLMKSFQERNQQEQMKGYNNFIHKPINETTVGDVLKMIRQREEFNRVFDLAMTRAVELLQENAFVGEYFDGELMEQIPDMDAEFYAAHSKELQAIVEDARKKSKMHAWLYDEAQYEFLMHVNSVSKKLRK